MYPFARMALELWLVRKAPPVPLTASYVSTHHCWPWDLDPWKELNNGRTLTLYDLGRLPLGRITGLHRVLRQNGWGMAVAGGSTRYRRRVRLMERITMVTRCIGWDHRFFYMEQAMWVRSDCASHVLLRTAVTSKSGIVPPAVILRALEEPEESPALPDWVQAWIAADATRPWPPGAAPA